MNFFTFPWSVGTCVVLLLLCIAALLLRISHQLSNWQRRP